MQLVGKEFIDYVREVRFGIDFDTKNLTEKQIASHNDKQKFINDAARLLKEIHAKKPHFILELIQNAEDNNYLENVEPKIKLIITSNELIIQNNEEGFSDRDVWGLCGMGDSKKEKKTGYIGEKGIGFKSVFMVTDEPHIYSNGFQFKFSYKKENPSSIIIPEWINEIKNYVDLEQTNIILPLKSEIKAEIIKYILQIDPSVLLFLKKLKLIEIENFKQGLPIKIEKHDYNTSVRILNNTTINYWKVIKKQFEPKIIEERRKDIEETEIVLAFPLNEDETADTNNEQFVFAFLPVRKYGFKFIIQADFLLPVSREDIIKGNAWNEWLRDNISSVFLHALENFKTDDNLKKSFLNYIPLENKAEVNDDFFTSVVRQIHNSLRKTDCILTESKKETWRKPIEVLYVNKDSKIRELFSNDDLKYFLNKEYISSDLIIKPLILSALGIDSFKFDNLLQCLQKTEWLNKQNDDWFIKLYTYLNRLNLDQEQIQKLKKLKIIRLEKDDELASNLNEPIFFPLENKSDYGFEKELRIIKRTILEPKETKNDIENFLGALKIHKAKPYEIIEGHILPIYESKNESSNWQIKDDAVLLGYINYIFDNLENYEKERKKRLDASKINDHPLKRLNNSLMIRTNKTFNNKKNYDRPENIYLPKYYGNKNDLETLFEHIEDIQFVSKEYIDTIVKKYRLQKRKNKKNKAEIRKKRETEIKAWGEFFDKIGVLKIPKVIYKENKIHDPFSDKVQNYGYTGSKLHYKSYLPEEYFKNPIKAFEEITDYKLELDIQNLNTKQRILLLKIIDENWSYYYGYFSKQLEYKYRYDRGNNKWSIDRKDCYFKYALINTGWLPITKNIDPLPKSNEVFLDKPETKVLLGESVPYLAVDIKNLEFVKALRINSDATVEGVLNYLKSIVQRQCKDKDAFINLYDFLYKNYENKQNIIETAFTGNKIIFIPDTHQYYFTIRDVLWKDLSDIFGENRGYLLKHYQKLKSFFVEKLGVNEKATPEDYANILLDLSQKEKLDKRDEKIIIEIYNELNSHLDPDIEEHLISSEDWWGDFIKKSIFWTDKNQFWKNDNNIYVNDKQEIYELFKNNSQIAFLKIPQNHLPKIQFFINSAKISYLSEAKPKLANVITSEIEIQLTERIQRFFPYILRYLYYSDHKTYKRLKKLGIFTHLKNFMCYSVESLKVEYILNKQSTHIEQKTFLDNDWKLYIKKDNLEDIDNLTVALSDFLKSKGIEYFLISLFEKDSDDKIEKLLKAMGIQELPDGEKEEQETKSTEDQQDAAKGTESEGQPESESPEKKEEQETKSTKDQQDAARDTESEGQPELESQKEKQETRSTKDQQDAAKDTESEWQPEPESPGKKKEQKTKSTKDQQDAAKDTENEWQPEFDPDDVEIKVDELQKKKIKESKTSDAKNRSNKKPVSSDEEDEVMDKLSPKAKKAIGKWGEEYALKYLQKKFCTKYSNGNIEKKPDGLIIKFNGQIKVEVHWLNKDEDNGEGYDIEVIENLNKKYIEVKSTKADAKDWFDVSRRQWELAQEEGDNFHIYRIYNAGTNKAKLVDIPNPSKLWEDGDLTAYPIRIQI